MDWPEITELNDVIITPVYPGSNKGALEFGASQPAEAFKHYRYGQTESFVTISPLPADAGLKPKFIEEPTIYGGLLFRHFGHVLAESIHRLWPRFALKTLNSAKVAFSLVNQAKVMPYMTEALNFHGLSKHDVIRIDEPMCFRRLFVGPQARQMAGPTLIDDYQAMLDPALAFRAPIERRDRKLYVSRLHYHHSGSFYGESWIARRLASEGFEIVFPETHSLTELVRMLRESSVAIFAEGSAIHALELCGSSTPEVFVIGRRYLSKERFSPLLSNICSKWQVSDRLIFNAGLSDDRKKHSGVLDLRALAADIDRFAGTSVRRDLTSDLVAKAVNEDVDQLAAASGSADGDERLLALRQEIEGRLARAGGLPLGG